MSQKTGKDQHPTLARNISGEEEGRARAAKRKLERDGDCEACIIGNRNVGAAARPLAGKYPPDAHLFCNFCL